MGTTVNIEIVDLWLFGICMIVWLLVGPWRPWRPGP